MRTNNRGNDRYRDTNRSDRRDESRRSSKPHRRGGILLIGFDDERPRTMAEKAGDAWRAFKGDKKKH